MNDVLQTRRRFLMYMLFVLAEKIRETKPLHGLFQVGLRMTQPRRCNFLPHTWNQASPPSMRHLLDQSPSRKQFRN